MKPLYRIPEGSWMVIAQQIYVRNQDCKRHIGYVNCLKVDEKCQWRCIDQEVQADVIKSLRIEITEYEGA